MIRQVAIADARNQLTALIRDAEAGRAVELTRRGKPVAVLVSSAAYERLRKRPKTSPLEAYRKWRASLDPGFEGFIDEEIASLRDRSPGREPDFG